MSEPTERCTFSLTQSDWEAEDRWDGTALEWTEICNRLDIDNEVWHCPHDPIPSEDGTASQHCVFHTPPNAVPREINENERLQAAIAAAEASDQSAEFLGATFEEFSLDALDPDCPIGLCGVTVEGSLSISTTGPLKLYADRATFRGPVSLDGATDDAVFANTVWQQEADFKDTVWQQEADFKGAEFVSDVQFTGAIFKNGVTFRRARVEGTAKFTGAEIDSKADFLNCHFGSQVVFDGAVQFKQAIFQNAHFETTADFEDAIFEGEANFSALSTDPTPCFGGETIFKNAKFGGDADFDDRRFEGEANFAEAEFSEDATFIEVSFLGPARFLYTEFKAEGTDTEASFQQVTFEDRVDFEETTLQADARFAEATFHNVTLFQNATFEGELDFAKPDPESVDREDPVRQRVRFFERTIFSGSTFGDSADLSDAEFQARVEFEDSTFEGETKFDRAEFHAESVFVKVEFQASVSFLGSQFHHAVQFREDEQFAASFDVPPKFPQANLSEADLRGAPVQNADFSGANLTEANLQGADFTGTQLEGALLNRANCYGTNFQEAALNGAVMGDAQINHQTEFGFGSSAADSAEGFCVYDPRYSPSKNVNKPSVASLQAAISTYQLIEQLAADNGLDQLQSRAFVCRQEMRSREKTVRAKEADDMETWLRAQFGRLLQTVSRVFMLYGERPKRVIGWGFVLIPFFSLLNLVVGVKPPNGGRLTLSQLIEEPSLISDLLYYTALGFAGIGIDTLQPDGFWARWTAVTTVLTGAVLISLFVFALGRQTAR